MTTPQDVSARLLNLKDELFFACPDGKISEQEDLLIDLFDFNGVSINGPEIITQAQSEKFPVLAAFRNSVHRNYISDRNHNCTIVLTDMDTEAVHCYQAFHLEKEPVKQPVDLKDPALKTSFSAKIVQFDLKKMIDFNWHGGTYAISVISFDFASNSIKVDLQDKPPREHPARPHLYPEPNPLSAIQENKLFFGKKYKAAFPSYERLDVVKTPTHQGIDFIIKPDTLSEKKPAKNPILYGSFLVPSKPLYLPEKTIEIDLADGNARKIQAVVPMTALFMRNNQSIPAYQLDMGIPVYSDHPLKPGGLMVGQFAVDLIQEGMGLDSDKYLCYIVLGGVLYGPQPFEFSL